jgi:putative MATE family efflux protein
MRAMRISGSATASSRTTRLNVFWLALPAVGEQLLNTLVGLVDVFLVGNLSVEASAQLGYGSATALTAAGLGNQFTWLMMVLFMAVGVGASALVARAVGARDEASLLRIVRQTFVLAALVGLVATAAGLLLAAGFLSLVAVPEEARAVSTAYIQINAAAFLPAVFLLVGTACMRASGDTRTPLWVMLGVNAVNVVVSWLLVNGQLGMPTLGVEGAALGSALARTLGGLAIIGLLLRGHGKLRLIPELRPDGEMLRRLSRIGLPTAGEQFAFQAALLIFVRFVTGLGTTVYAAHNITITIESLSFLPGMGYAAATGALVGQALGARDPRQAERYAYEGLLQGGLMMATLGVVMFLFPAPIVALFSNDPAVIAAAAPILRAAGLMQPSLAGSFIVLGALRGAGDTRWPLFSRILTTWVMRLPLVFLLVGVLDLGLAGIWLAMATDFTLQAILALWRFSSGRWQRIEL